MSSDAEKASVELSEKFHPERTHILGAVVFGLISLLVIGAAPQYLFWLLALPVIFGYWVLKSSTIVDEQGITANYAFKGKKVVAWEDLAGIGFKGARTFARTTSDAEVTLPGVTFNSLPRLEAASHGRIPDAITASKEAADGKVVVVQEDGYSVMMSKEEYLERQKALGKPVQLNFDDGTDGNTTQTESVESQETGQAASETSHRDNPASQH
ncbi:hypothetical protein YH66_06780 [[Brevibacterium] flavum]|uniref:Low molecular weight protein antigen 6 PH domain-containing protein n=1 Tax=[Brevibacterium] flavum TaxID=92706 RepID=A0A0F6Z684_9CORY|nr:MULTISPECIES: PH domain-containing protein [Corynebacterium]AJE67236.1 hypothetical protein SB89_06575 [Corynebacterium glutamicum]AKF27281.1 hypothetical protein YH66_06780 [[Brevibacterium] flavum]ANE08104.1 hypothetical protein A3654_06795 [Corynebacterium glutamicum]AST20525.1 hypothetical protein CEY17_06875 [Corynebacterium glutamicum ATCC 14067]KEI23012.1 hypothetical protein KIQ_010640 [Corynebacterium glutamicum ATCC 14067]